MQTDLIGFLLTLDPECFTYDHVAHSGTSNAQSTFNLQPITCGFVSKFLRQQKTNKAIGLDKISSCLLKDAEPVITPSLTKLFNLSIKNKTFPKIWKAARIVPVHKAGARDNPSNYRPISILPAISKILEKAIHNQLSSYLNDNHLLTTDQYGFRHNSSTVIATTKFTDNVLKSMDDGEITGAIFLDLAKAFDTVNHKILLSKLSSLGVDPHACEWFQSFLSALFQITVVDDVHSEPARVSIGVAHAGFYPRTFTVYYLYE